MIGKSFNEIKISKTEENQITNKKKKDQFAAFLPQLVAGVQEVLFPIFSQTKI